MYGCIHAPGIAASGIARHFSPLVEAIDPATVVMDLTGMQRLLGSPAEIPRRLRGRPVRTRALPWPSIAPRPCMRRGGLRGSL